MHKLMKKVTIYFLALLVVIISATPGFAEYPEKNVTYIIPFGPGGESDVSARLQQPYFRKLFKKEMIIQYKPGAGGAVGWSILNTLPADGYTIMGTNLPHITLQPLQRNSSYKQEDIVNVHFFHYTPDALLVPADSPYKTLDDFIQAAKKEPGKFTLAGTGTFSANDTAQSNLDYLAGIKTVYIPFKTTADATLAMLGKQVKGSWGFTTVALQQGDKVRVLGVATDERHPLLPDAPTFKEQGYNMVGGGYRGIAVPKNTSEEMRKEVSRMVQEINNQPEFRRQMEEAGFTMVDIPYEKVEEFMKERTAYYHEVAKRVGLK